VVVPQVNTVATSLLVMVSMFAMAGRMAATMPSVLPVLVAMMFPLLNPSHPICYALSIVDYRCREIVTVCVVSPVDLILV
jgi:hypothetical protein